MLKESLFSLHLDPFSSTPYSLASIRKLGESVKRQAEASTVRELEKKLAEKAEAQLASV